MRQLITCCAIAVMFTGMVVSTSNAGDREDVLAAHDAILAAWNTGDVEKLKQYYVPELTRFGGSSLMAHMWDWDNLNTQWQAGLKITLQPRHRQVVVYGNTAIISGYLVNSTTQPDGTTQNATNQYTAVFVKQGGKWKEAHLHQSPLEVQPSQ